MVTSRVLQVAALVVAVSGSCNSLCQATSAQKPPRPPYVRDGTAVAAPDQSPVHPEIHVDQLCRILPNPNQPLAANGKKPHPKADYIVCHLESVNSSSHVEEMLVSGTRQRTSVSIHEQEYVLQNILPEPATFVIENPVPKDWQVDSDPQPTEMAGSVAIFRVEAQPGQIVRLHVGLRHAKAKKPKSSSTSAPTAPPSPST
jgi:hypothetical protein